MACGVEVGLVSPRPLLRGRARSSGGRDVAGQHPSRPLVTQSSDSALQESVRFRDGTGAGEGGREPKGFLAFMAHG